MNTIFILAGTYDQFCIVVRRLKDAMFAEGIPFHSRDFIFMTEETIRGHRDIWGYKFGTWRNRKDLHILEQIVLARGSSIENDFIEVDV